jgi:enamine deaminase RidA (YjgF/YER057c/UK114 family)
MALKRFALLVSLACGTASAQNEFLKPEGIASASGYSHVVVTQPGKLIFIAGQVANDREGRPIGKDDLKAQAEQVFANVKTALAAAGATFADVVKVTTFVKNYRPELLPILRGVREKYINPEHPPASTLVGVASLAQDAYLIEMEAVAAVPEIRKLESLACSAEPSLRSVRFDTQTTVTFENPTPNEVRLYWINYQGGRVPVGAMKPGQSLAQRTFLTHPFVLTDRADKCLAIYLPALPQSVAVYRE